jgi:hypothetical protein
MNGHAIGTPYPNQLPADDPPAEPYVPPVTAPPEPPPQPPPASLDTAGQSTGQPPAAVSNTTNVSTPVQPPASGIPPNASFPIAEQSGLKLPGSNSHLGDDVPMGKKSLVVAGIAVLLIGAILLMFEPLLLAILLIIVGAGISLAGTSLSHQ